MSDQQSSAKTTSYVLYGLGLLLLIPGALLAMIGTTEMGLFVVYVVMIFAGMGLLIAGQKFARRG